MDYVLVLIHNKVKNEFVFVRKQKPEYQKNKINIPGGKIEPNELPIQAAIREVYEETGIVADNIAYSGCLKLTNGIIYCYYLTTETYDLNPAVGEIEHFFWASHEEMKDNPDLIEHLNTTINMILDNAQFSVVL